MLDISTSPAVIVTSRIPCDRVLAAVVYRDIGTDPLRALPTVSARVDRDDLRGGVEPRCEDRRQADRPGADDRAHIARRDHAVEHADPE
jgi:hypothetical protein